MSDTALLEELRPRAFGIAYRMLGSVADADDIAQEALLRVHHALERGDTIASPIAFVATIATRLAIDELRSARVRRETYVGTWLPEPLITDAPGESIGERSAELAESMSVAFLVLLESLSPEQRAVLLLRDAFDYGYDEIASILGTTVVNARQLATRARRHVLERRPRFQASHEQRDELARRFFDAARAGDLASLEELLAEDVVLYGDGGGRVPAIQRPVHGRQRVAQMLLAWSVTGLRGGGAQLRDVQVNGAPGSMLLDRDGRLLGVMTLGFAGERIGTVTSVVNPDKLRHIGETGDMRELLRRAQGVRSSRTSNA
jgi:RNA polymerase sigma-70 factor (ECF subfamily)